MIWSDLCSGQHAIAASMSFADPRTCGNCMASKHALSHSRRTYAGALFEQPDTVARMVACLQSQASSKQTPGATFYCEKCMRHTFLLRSTDANWFCSFEQQLERSEAVQRSLGIMMKQNTPRLASTRRSKAATQASKQMSCQGKRKKSRHGL